jgi:hypothetical protein
VSVTGSPSNDRTWFWTGCAVSCADSSGVSARARSYGELLARCCAPRCPKPRLVTNGYCFAVAMLILSCGWIKSSWLSFPTLRRTHAMRPLKLLPVGP